MTGKLKRQTDFVFKMAFMFPIEREPQKAIIGGAVVFSLLPLLAVAGRIMARLKFNNARLDLSDWLIIAACVSTLIRWNRIILHLQEKNSLLTKM